MASDTAPAAIPDPAGTPPATAATGPTTGPVAGLLAPIEPARPTSAAFTLDPTTDGADTAAQSLAGASSSAYQNATDGPDAKGSKDGRNSQQSSVLRAFALAAIERWKKAGDARNKRLDIQKAKAQAHQTKEARTVNRSEKFTGGSAASGLGSGKSTGGGKGAGSPSGSGGGKGRSGAGTGGKSGNGSGGGGSQPKGRSGSDGKGTGGGRGPKGSTGTGSTGNGGATPKTSKNQSKDSQESAHTGTGGKKTPGKGGAGTSTQTCGDSSGISLTKDKASKTRKDSKAGDGSGTGKKSPAGTGPSGTAPGPGKDSTAPKAGKGKDQDAPSSKQNPDGDTKKVDLKKTGPKKDTKTGKDTKDSTGSKPDKDTDKPAGGPLASSKKLDTKPSREAGYRDGSRTAVVTAHVRAYRDGFKDGHRDTTEAAGRDKDRLDKAHAQRKQQRAQETKDQPVNASSTDYQTEGPRPIEVKEVTAQQVTLEGGRTLSHGEVRSLKQYERRMGDKATNMDKAAEGSRTLKAHAEQQAEQALKYLEMAKNVEGGEAFIGILNRLNEAATIQIREAEELHKRVVRAAENTRVVLTNVDIRYGGIYKAVIDSGLIAPAKLHWYRK